MGCRNICLAYEIQEPSEKKCTDKTQQCKNCGKFLNYDGFLCPCCNQRLFKAIKIIKKREQSDLKQLHKAERQRQLERKRIQKAERRRQREIILKQRAEKKAAWLMEYRTPEESERLIADALTTITQKAGTITFRINEPKLNHFQLCEIVEPELRLIQKERKRQGYANMRNPVKQNHRHNLPRDQRSPYHEAAKILGIAATKIEKIIRIKMYGNDDLFNKIRTNQASITEADSIIRGQRSIEPRYNWRNKLLPNKRQSPYKFCPCCGTETLERWYNVKEIKCTTCGYFYTLSRRHHGNQHQTTERRIGRV